MTTAQLKKKLAITERALGMAIKKIHDSDNCALACPVEIRVCTGCVTESSCVRAITAHFIKLAQVKGE